MTLECLHPYFPFSKWPLLSFSRTFILHTSLVCIGGDFHNEFIKHESIKFYKYCNIQFMLRSLNNTNVQEHILFMNLFFQSLEPLSHYINFHIKFIWISFWRNRFYIKVPITSLVNLFYYFNVLVSWYSRNIEN
jgi:hypothetical protein